MLSNLRLLLICTFVCRAALGQASTDSVKGVVLDDGGKPLAKATVYAVGAQDMTKQIRTTSDSDGHFVLQSLPPGLVYIDAYKESDGYPYSFFSFYKVPDSETPVPVRIKTESETQNIVLHLGPRTAYLKVDVEGEDESPLSGMLSFERFDIPGPYKRSVSSKDTVAVPPVPFRITFEAPGYLPWHFDKVVALKSGESMVVKIRPTRLPGR